MTVAAPDKTPERELAPAGSDLVLELELAFRLLGKRIYLPSLRSLRDAHGGVDKASFPLLTVLDEQDDRRPSDVAAMLELDISTVSRHINHLERVGLVNRRPDEDDGRACRISLTEKGRQSIAAVRLTRAQLLGAVFDGWPEHDRAELLRLLSRLLDGVQELPTSHLDRTATGSSR